MSYPCPRCAALNSAEQRFCYRCSTNLEPRTDLWLRVEDYASSTDQDALNMLKATGPLPFIANTFMVGPRMRKFKESLRSRAIVSSEIEQLESVIKDCARRLCLETLPTVYVDDLGHPNAFTFGDDREPMIVLDRTLLNTLTKRELLAVLGHEMGHVKAQHLVYHSLAEMMLQGAGLSGLILGFEAIVTPIRLALLAWHRESELTADRAALICSLRVEHVASMFAKLVGIPFTISKEEPSLSQAFLEAFRSHPVHTSRIQALMDFSRSEDYATVMKKIQRRQMFTPALVGSCKLCGARKPVRALVCPSCQRSQV